ncbi:MAG: hypothetical protein U1B80_01110 [Anaerolineaceae bacterium]|nr:hypothetical protein [Anaerolineaceae bacterium]
MPRIRCHYLDCAFLDDGYCSAAAVELDPDTGCMTCRPNIGEAHEDDWDEEDEFAEWEEGEEQDLEDELWEEDEEAY